LHQAVEHDILHAPSSDIGTTTMRVSTSSNQIMAVYHSAIDLDATYVRSLCLSYAPIAIFWISSFRIFDKVNGTNNLIPHCIRWYRIVETGTDR